jgi:hypothetical protein
MALKHIAAPSIAADMDDLDVERLNALDCYDLLDTPPEPQFDRIARLIRDIFDMPMAVVSVIDGHRQWYKASEGLSATEVPLKESFCRQTILDTKPLVVPDAMLDTRFAENPSVTGAPHVRFYAGAPLTTPDGHKHRNHLRDRHQAACLRCTPAAHSRNAGRNGHARARTETSRQYRRADRDFVPPRLRRGGAEVARACFPA